MSQGFTRNFAQLASVRFILGLVEGMFVGDILVNVSMSLVYLSYQWHGFAYLTLQHHFYRLCLCC